MKYCSRILRPTRHSRFARAMELAQNYRRKFAFSPISISLCILNFKFLLISQIVSCSLDVPLKSHLNWPIAVTSSNQSSIYSRKRDSNEILHRIATDMRKDLHQNPRVNLTRIRQLQPIRTSTSAHINGPNVQNLFEARRGGREMDQIVFNRLIEPPANARLGFSMHSEHLPAENYRLEVLDMSPNGNPRVPDRYYLPNGPPPFRPTTWMLGMVSNGALEKLQRSKALKQIYKVKISHLFSDLLRQLWSFAEKFRRHKNKIAGTKMEAMQIALNKLVHHDGQAFKFKWPLVMLNPNFVKEILSNPTFLVMLFHAVEVAYMSMPMNLWLKPLMRLVKQPSPEKEEQVWWRRKRFYDTLNGRGSSELQPNLKTVHFRNPGRPTPVAIPNLVNMIRHLAGKPGPTLAYYHQPKYSPFQDSHLLKDYPTQDSRAPSIENSHPIYLQTIAQTTLDRLRAQTYSHKHHAGSSPTIVNNWQLQIPDDALIGQQVQFNPLLTGHHPTQATANEEEWFMHPPSSDQIMSNEEFEMLEPRERESVLKEAKERLEESRWTNELIKQHSDYVESLKNQHDTSIRMSHLVDGGAR